MDQHPLCGSKGLREGIKERFSPAEGMGHEVCGYPAFRPVLLEPLQDSLNLGRVVGIVIHNQDSARAAEHFAAAKQPAEPGIGAGGRCRTSSRRFLKCLLSPGLLCEQTHDSDSRGCGRGSVER